MDDQYPFGKLRVEPDVRPMVRKIVHYTRSNYSSLREKLELSRTLDHSNLVRLERVLEEEGRFHLMYEYVPEVLKVSILSREDYLELLKTKLMYMCAYLAERKIMATLRADNLGVDAVGEFKYYLDSDFYIYKEESQAVRVHTHYLQQVQRLCEDLVSQINITDISSEPKTSFQWKSRQRSFIESNSPHHVLGRQSDHSRTRDEGRPSFRNSRSPTSNNSSVGSRADTTSRYKPIETTLQLLTSIEMKLERLKESLKRSPKHADPSQRVTPTNPTRTPPPLERKKVSPVVALKKEKFPQSRKYSGQIQHILPLARRLNVAESARSVRQPHNRNKIYVNAPREPSELDIQDGKRQPTYISLATSAPNRKKHHAEQTEKKGYHFPKREIHRRFLEDEQDIGKIVRQLEKSGEETILGKEGSGETMILSTATELPVSPEDNNKELEESKKYSAKNVSRRVTEYDALQQRNNQLQERINRALKKSDEAIKVYRKKSFHSITTEFGKKSN